MKGKQKPKKKTFDSVFKKSNSFVNLHKSREQIVLGDKCSYRIFINWCALAIVYFTFFFVFVVVVVLVIQVLWLRFPIKWKKNHKIYIYDNHRNSKAVKQNWNSKQGKKSKNEFEEVDLKTEQKRTKFSFHQQKERKQTTNLNI